MTDTPRSRTMTVMEALHVYDTTLRDGAQQEGLNLSVSDKLAIARLLDELGVGFIEGGWPGANPKDTEFFSAPKTSCTCGTHAGGLRRDATGGVKAAEDPLVAALRGRRASVSASSPSRTSGTSRRRCARPSTRTSRWCATP